MSENRHDDVTEPLSLLDALEVVRGDAAPEELAALVAVVAAHAAAQPAGYTRRVPLVRSAWCTPALRRPLPLGAGAWQAALRRH